MCLFYCFNFERIYEVLKSKGSNKNISFNKNETEWKISHTIFERQILYFSSYKNHKLKVKLWWIGVPERKMSAFFVPFILFTVYYLLCFISIYSVNTLSEFFFFFFFTTKIYFSNKIQLQNYLTNIAYSMIIHILKIL